MSAAPLTLSVKMSAVAITPIYLEDLASEYYGRVLHLAGNGESDETVIEFASDDAAAHLKGFKSALDSYLIPT